MERITDCSPIPISRARRAPRSPHLWPIQTLSQPSRSNISCRRIHPCWRKSSALPRCMASAPVEKTSSVMPSRPTRPPWRGWIKLPLPTVTVTAEMSNSPTLTGDDIGKVARKGSNTAANGTYTITSSGSDVWGTSDAFRFDETSLSGNGTIIAQVSSMGDSSAWAKAGVMIRSSNSANAQEVSLMVFTQQHRGHADPPRPPMLKHHPRLSAIRRMNGSSLFAAEARSTDISPPMASTGRWSALSPFR